MACGLEGQDAQRSRSRSGRDALAASEFVARLALLVEGFLIGGSRTAFAGITPRLVLADVALEGGREIDRRFYCFIESIFQRFPSSVRCAHDLQRGALEFWFEVALRLFLCTSCRTVRV